MITETVEETEIEPNRHTGGTIRTENSEYYYTACKSCGANLSDLSLYYMNGERHYTTYDERMIKKETQQQSTTEVPSTTQPNTDTQTDSTTNITVPNTSLKLKAKKKGFKITLKKISSVDGYEIRFSTKKNFKGAKFKKVKKNQTSVTINKLKSKKKYYVSVRSYKVVDNKIYYSDWSKTKSVKTK